MNALPRGGDFNAKGRYYEVLFKAECLRRRLEVLSPECTHLPFDVAIFSNNKFLRIQVKGTPTIQVRPKRKSIDRVYRFNVRNARRTNYADLGVDFIAGFVEPLDSWYIIPAAAITAQLFEVRPNATGKAAEFKERWDLLSPHLPEPNLPQNDGFDRRTVDRQRVSPDILTGANAAINHREMC